MRRAILGFAAMAVAALGVSARGAVSATTTHGPGFHSLDGLISATDLIEGQIGVEQPGDRGWHPANTNPADRLPAFTDGKGALDGLTGLLNDFPGDGTPTKLVRYTLNQPTNVGTINIFTGNGGLDGRVFSTTVVLYSTDGTNFNTLGYFQSDPSGTVNSGQWGSTEVSINTGGLPGVQALQFNFYAVDNSQGQIRDPFSGVNPYTGVDDGLSVPITSPLVLEIDVLPVPEPAGLVGIGSMALLPLLRRRRR